MPPLRRIRALAAAAALTAAAAAVGADPDPPLPELREDGRRVHECSHDSPARRAAEAAVAAKAHAHFTELRRAERGFGAQAASARKPMRFRLSFADLWAPGHYCNAGKYRSVPDLQGGKAACPADKSQDLTPAKRLFLVNKLLPVATARLSELLSVVPETAPIKFSSCGSHKVPAAIKRDGAADADFVLHVAAAPTWGSTSGWAGVCEFDFATMRPVAGYANFGPRFIDPAGDFEEQLETVVHELMHALGFGRTFFGNDGAYQIPTAVIERRGINVTVIRGPAVLREGKAHFGCSDFDGMELENEGGGGTAGGHFERRLMMQDTMTGISGSKISRMTLAVFEDLGFYGVNYSAADDTTTFGRNGGCGFLREKCNTVAGGRDKWFCFGDTEESCNRERTGVQYCAVGRFTTAVPAPFRYFPREPKKAGTARLMDFCPVKQVWGNRQCGSATHKPSLWDGRLGQYFGAGGRCIDGSGFGKRPYTSGSVSPVCVQTRCRGSALDVKLPAAGAAWLACPPGKNVTDSMKFNGHLSCPPVGDICGTGGPSPATPLPTPDTSTPAPKRLPVTPKPTAMPTPEPLPVAPREATYTVTVRRSGSTVDSKMSGPNSVRMAFLRAVTQQIRAKYNYPWPTYKVERSFKKAGGIWAITLHFTGPEQTAAVTPVPVLPAPDTSTPAPKPVPKPVPMPAPTLAPKPLPVAPREATYTVTVRRSGGTVDTKMLGSTRVRMAYLRAVTQQIRAKYNYPWPTYKVERSFKKAGGIWAITLHFTGPEQTAAVTPAPAIPKPTPAPKAPRPFPRGTMTTTVTINMWGRTVDAAMTGAASKRDAHVAALTKDARTKYDLPAPDYEVSVTYKKQGFFWSFRLVFTGPARSASLAVLAEDAPRVMEPGEWPAVLTSLGVADGITRPDGSIEPPAHVSVHMVTNSTAEVTRVGDDRTGDDVVVEEEH